uniref:Uncharacterized protein n=1 Tax=Glossina austeni TaxID=7395 RepID=A0A1A9VH05_GLOAU
MTPPLRVTWANFLHRDELQACLKEFDFDITRTVQEMRRRWAQFINQDHKPEVVTWLLQLQTELEALTRHRLLSPASHARTGANGTSIDEKGPLHPPTNAATLHVPVTIKGADSQVIPVTHSTIATTTNDTRKTSWPPRLAEHDSGRHETCHRSHELMELDSDFEAIPTGNMLHEAPSETQREYQPVTRWRDLPKKRTRAPDPMPQKK